MNFLFTTDHRRAVVDMLGVIAIVHLKNGW